MLVMETSRTRRRLNPVRLSLLGRLLAVKDGLHCFHRFDGRSSVVMICSDGDS